MRDLRLGLELALICVAGVLVFDEALNPVILINKEEEEEARLIN